MLLLVKEKRDRILDFQIRFRPLELGSIEEVAVGHLNAVRAKKLPIGLL